MRRATIVLALGATACAGAGSVPVSDTTPSPADQALSLIEASPDLDGKPVGSTRSVSTIVVVFASWCGHCKDELEVIGGVLGAHPSTRVLGINYRGHEEYDGRGNAQAVRAYVARLPWLRVVPANESVFAALGRPPMIPTLFIYDRSGTLVERYDRREREMPDADELAALLRRLGA